jgi:hypothetical protein
MAMEGHDRCRKHQDHYDRLAASYDEIWPPTARPQRWMSEHILERLGSPGR